MAAVFASEAMDTSMRRRRRCWPLAREGDALRTNLAVLKRFTKYEPVNIDRPAQEDRGAVD